ncbi:MAG: protein serine/threonine phosphatase [Bacteroidetes bacterium]|jgi:serine phosphatase RsbU (regulator of sigma subunit)|nr:protein serine/threonine phosphatase [Bacteroidota bacterium]
MKKALLLFLVTANILLFSQKADTVLIDKLIEDCKRTELFNFDSALYYGEKALRLSEKAGDSLRIATVLRRMGNVHLNLGNLDKCLELQKKSLRISENINYKQGIASCLSNIANVEVAQSLNNDAIEHYQKALLIFLEINDMKGYARILGNIGLVCQFMKDNKKALNYQLKSYEIRKQLKDTVGLSLAAGNVGNLYGELKRYDSCFHFFEEALFYSKRINSLQGTAILYANYGSLLKDSKDFTKAERMLQKAYLLSEEIHEISNKANAAIGLAQIFAIKGDHKKALEYVDTCISLSFKTGELAVRSNGYKVKSEILKNSGKPVDALKYFEMHYLLKDSILNDENKADFAKKEMQLQHEQEKLQQKLEQEKKEAIAGEKIKQQKTIQIFLFSILIGFIILSFYIYRNYKQKKNANLALESKNKEIEEQRSLLETKNSEILDSIHYAKRIQTALLASENLISEHLPEHFIFYKPKDIVSGDFYWASAVDSKFIFATCDCTGHGVPGAFMSLLNISFLNEVTSQKKIIQPDKIFEEVRKDIINALNKDAKEETKDGMDGVLLSYDLKNNTLEFTAANNPVIIIRNNELLKFTPDKFPVGLSHGALKPFTLQTQDLMKGDCIYTFTDGISDQFGGEKGKKFKQKRLEELLVKIHTRPMSEQHEILGKEFENWKGSLEQVDDVLVIAVRI